MWKTMLSKNHLIIATKAKTIAFSKWYLGLFYPIEFTDALVCMQLSHRVGPVSYIVWFASMALPSPMSLCIIVFIKWKSHSNSYRNRQNPIMERYKNTWTESQYCHQFWLDEREKSLLLHPADGTLLQQQNSKIYSPVSTYVLCEKLN